MTQENDPTVSFYPRPENDNYHNLRRDRFPPKGLVWVAVAGFKPKGPAAMLRCRWELCPLRHTGILAGDNPLQIEDYRRLVYSSFYARRQVIFREDNPCLGIHILCSGTVKISQTDRFGKIHLLKISRPGDILGDVAAYDHPAYAVTAEAVDDSLVCFLAKESLLDFLNRYPDVALRLLSLLSRELRSSQEKMRDFALKGAEGRLAAFLLKLAGDYGEKTREGIRIRLPLSRGEMGEAIGVAPETVIRLLGKLAQKRILKIRHRNCVLADPGRLQEIAD